MNQYFIFKNESSENFNGLIVSELPPISKPTKRVETTTIDGRDGDIIEFLGYESYDKEIQVGLSRGYDIDALFEWLDGSGELILSNEPDKKYRAEVIDGIDFERLVCFKTAKIKFHCQPYKYSSTETIKFFTPQNSSGTLIVKNSGNTDALPDIYLNLTGILTLKINGSYVCTISAGTTSESLTLFCEKEEIRSGSFNESQPLKTFKMSGDFPVLLKGENVIEYSVTDGTLLKMYFKRISRWI